MKTLTVEDHIKNVKDLREASPLFGVRVTDIRTGFAGEALSFEADKLSVFWFAVFDEPFDFETDSTVLVEDEPEAIDQNWNSLALFRVLRCTHQFPPHRRETRTLLMLGELLPGEKFERVLIGAYWLKKECNLGDVPAQSGKRWR